ncbi:MAG: ferrochelatase [Coriobacteriia bacterium]
MLKAGVLITGFGGPDRLEAVGPFMCNLMGREPSPEVLARICARYERIGGASPLPGIARELGDNVAAALSDAGREVPVAIGMRYTDPSIAEGVQRLADAGADHVVLVTLSPFETQVTHGEYRAALEEALVEHEGMTASEAPLFSDLPAFVALHTAAARVALDSAAPGALLIFSAHSLPMSDAIADSSYVDGLRASADAVAAAAGLPEGAEAEIVPGIVAYGSTAGDRAWALAYQSQGVRGGEWLGPDTDAVIEAAAAAGAPGVVVVPIGFATDHLETLYDLDVVAAERAAAAGVAFVRSAVPNAAPELAHDIASAVIESIDRG